LLINGQPGNAPASRLELAAQRQPLEIDLVNRGASQPASNEHAVAAVVRHWSYPERTGDLSEQPLRLLRNCTGTHVAIDVARAPIKAEDRIVPLARIEDRVVLVVPKQRLPHPFAP